MTTKQKSFFKGALILTIAGVLGRMLGALYRIPFNRIVGEEGSALRPVVFALFAALRIVHCGDPAGGVENGGCL